MVDDAGDKLGVIDVAGRGFKEVGVVAKESLFEFSGVVDFANAGNRVSAMV